MFNFDRANCFPNSRSGDFIACRIGFRLSEQVFQHLQLCAINQAFKNRVLYPLAEVYLMFGDLVQSLFARMEVVVFTS